MIFGFKEDKSKVDILNMFYPIGCYFHTSNGNFNPNTEWGGNWTLVEEGQVLLAGSTDGTYEVGNEYGSNTHTLVQAEIPDYEIGFIATGVPDYHIDWNNAGIFGSSKKKGSRHAIVKGTQETATTTQYGWSVHTNGGGAAHSIMQASTAVYIWHRIA